VQRQAAKLALIVADGIAARSQTRHRITEHHEQRTHVPHSYPAPQGCGSRSGPVLRTPLPRRRTCGRETRSSGKNQEEIGTMRIIVRALGIAVGGCLIALFLYLMLSLAGVLSDRDSIVALTATQRSPAQQWDCPHWLVENRSEKQRDGTVRDRKRKGI
jgi:hypothetical protein